MITTSRKSQKQLVHDYGVTRGELNHAILNMFHVPPVLQVALSNYAITHCTGTHFANSLRNGTLNYTSTMCSYQVIYQDCTPYNVKRAHELKLSWREAVEDYNLPATVIVRIVTEKEV